MARGAVEGVEKEGITKALRPLCDKGWSVIEQKDNGRMGSRNHESGMAGRSTGII